MTFSIVIPVYNDASYLRNCLEAIAAQTIQPLEVIVVDNNCSDDSATVAKEYGARVIKESRQGIGAAAARGYNAAWGDIIVRCDADSLPPRNWLETIEQSFAHSGKPIAVTGPGRFYDVSLVMRFIADIYYMRAYFALVGSALAATPLFGSNFAMKRSIWKTIQNEIHSDRNDIHDDIDLTYHLLAHGTIKYDAALCVGISGRPLSDWKGSRVRVSRGFQSIMLHRDNSSPFKRYEAKVKKAFKL
jgi:glycosyltransferase involved in cell wall biosynthesis